MGIKIETLSCKNCKYICEKAFPCKHYAIRTDHKCPHGIGESPLSCPIGRQRGTDLCLNCKETKINCVPGQETEPVIEKKIKFTIRK